MELQLALALPTQNSFEGFNPNKPGLMKSKQIVSSELCRTSCCSESKKHVRNKRSFQESFGHCVKPLPLLVWSGQPNEEDDNRKKRHRASNKNEEENHLVGWPPIKSWRNKELHPQHPVRGQIRNERMQANENRSRGTNSSYVKVNMEGVPIGRLINLRLYNSYQTLTDALISMFVGYQTFEENGAGYTLTFQNKQGEWLLPRHVPWQTFIGTVRRLAILRNGNENI
ncbi:auxin-responsive protein IAA28 [Lotus japonicus]|uniref:auxin-responsive protein IAA28 n=1 Tax=Lotus japonicus TaxID=34305 RepID=UPI00258C5DAE|nr:auxin-responsive protein IAA28 [Lotus japonicus]